MLNLLEDREPTPEEQEQIRYLDALEETMDQEIQANRSRVDEWIDRLESELEKPDYCQEARQHINWLLYRLMDGGYDGPMDVYAEQLEVAGIFLD